MTTTPEQIRFAYSNTISCSNGIPIEKCLSDIGPAIFETFRYMKLEKSPFGAHKFYENGIYSFNITYKMGPFDIIVIHFKCGESFPFNTVESFAKWLNDCERKILKSAANLIKEKNES